ncbi:MAG: pentapeptide repeat-containing protein [Planctomycetota bacterium]|nr:pentapeptide repeat-containing protein [Planctomycetota bacterium]
MFYLTIRTAVLLLVFPPILFCIVEQCTHADVEPPRVVLGPEVKDLIVGPGMNAAGRDLRGCEFVTQDLTGAIFDGCNLYGVRIDGCILKRASFRGTIFQGANVEVSPDDKGADFTNATISGVWRSSAEGFDFYGLGLSPHQLMSTWSYKNKDLHQCRIRCSNGSGEAVSLDFRGADLREATIQGDCSKCDFTDARIFGARFAGSSITFDQLASTFDFKRRRLRVRLIISKKTAARSSGKWDFSRINLKGSHLYYPPPDADFTDARIKGCTIRNGLTKRQLYSTASYKQGNLTGLRLISSDLSGCALSGMNLTGCRFSHCKFADTNFENAVITDAWFGGDEERAKPDRLTLDQIKSTWNYKHDRMEGITLPKDIAAALDKERKTKADKSKK